MKKVKIFLIPSSDALEDDVTQIGDFFRQLNDMYLDSGVRFILNEVDEQELTGIGDAVADSDLSFFLFFKEISETTRREFDIVFDSFKNTGKPKVVTYFKYVDTKDEMENDVLEFSKMLDEELRHYYQNYNSIDTLKLGMLMQIKLMKLDASVISVYGGMVCLNGQAVADTNNIPMFARNGSLSEFKRREKELTKEWYELRSLREKDPDNDDLYFRFSRVATERDNVIKKIRELENTLFEISEKFAEGKEMSPRQAEAYRLIEEGDVEGVLKVLDLKELFEDIEHNERLAEGMKNRLETNVEELATRIDALKARGKDIETVQEILEIYEKIYSLCCEHFVGWSKLYDYADFLYDKKDYSRAIEVAEKLNWYYSSPDCEVDEYELTKLFNLLGMLYYSQNQPSKAEKYYLAAIEIIERLVKKDADTYETNLVGIYNNAGTFYDKLDSTDKAEKYYLAAIEINERLAKRNADAYEPPLVGSYNNAGDFYSKQGQTDKAEKYLLVAIEICERLVEKNVDAYEPYLAVSYNNAGAFYHKRGQMATAEKYYLAAIEINERLVKRNTDTYEPDLAISYNNAGVFYDNKNQFAKAEKYYLAAIEIYERLVKKNPDAYEPYLADVYNTAGDFYRKQDQTDKVEKYHLAAIEMYWRLVKKRRRI